jgi:apolipoprotein N-acyltransferase
VFPGPGERLFPALSGILLALSFPPLHLLIPPFVAFIPFALWCVRLPPGVSGARSAARGGFFLGIVAHGLLLHWLLPALIWTMAWAPVAFFTVVAVLSTLAALFGWVLHRIVHGAGVPIWLALPVAWTAKEWAQGHLPGPFSFPWLELPVALTGFPELLGLAEIAGGRGVSFWLVMVSGLGTWVIAGWRAHCRRWRVAASVVVAVVAVSPGLWGMHRAGTMSTVPVARVALIGTDLPVAMRADADRWNAAMASELDDALRGLAGEDLDLLVLPEGALMAPATVDGDATIYHRLSDVAATLDAAALLGVYTAGPASENQAVLLTPDGTAHAPYRKRRLVPLVEWLPGDAPPDSGTPVVLSRTSAGPSGQSRARVRYGPLICFETVFPDVARRARLAGAQILVNVSNDAWFTASGGLGIVGRHQHAAHLVVRAVEHRVGAVRSANGGPSFGVHPSGRIEAASVGRTVTVLSVRSGLTRTVYTRTGDWVGPLSILFMALLLTVVEVRGRRHAPVS